MVGQGNVEQQELVNHVAEIVDVGIHTLLRKTCNSDGANKAWQGIEEMPNEEWECVCEVVAKHILKKMNEYK